MNDACCVQTANAKHCERCLCCFPCVRARGTQMCRGRRTRAATAPGQQCIAVASVCLARFNIARLHTLLVQIQVPLSTPPHSPIALGPVCTRPPPNCHVRSVRCVASHPIWASLADLSVAELIPFCSCVQNSRPLNTSVLSSLFIHHRHR